MIRRISKEGWAHALLVGESESDVRARSWWWLKESARSAKTVIPAVAPFEAGLSGESTDIRDLIDLKPEDVTANQLAARHDLDATNKASAILRKGGDRATGTNANHTLPPGRGTPLVYLPTI